MYRLNMFRSVAQLPIEPSCWRSRLAKAVSLAACGELAAAQENVVSFLSLQHRAQHKMALAHGLAPFMPRETLKIIEGAAQSPPAFHVALLLRNDRLQQARNLLAQLGPDTFERNPELSLCKPMPVVERLGSNFNDSMLIWPPLGCHP